ncbi:MAG: hypothetical protein NTX25_01510 [Proteobacteria bacterium]|nr:hypothetical protein [Pseudomonadota bacterium]
MTDDIEKSLRSMTSNLPNARPNLSEKDKDQLIAALGILTVENIRKALATLPHSRIPFLFSSLNSQDVVDIMANDLDAAIARAHEQKKRVQSTASKRPSPSKKR